MQKITRISYNSAEWRNPTGEAREVEAAGTYNYENGFGHEDWLFRSEWIIDGWRYAFLQGVNKSHAKLVREGLPFDVKLFTIQPDKRRRWVASISDVECLDDTQADDALEAFKRRGWYDEMLGEVRGVDGNASALGDTEWSKHILNVRFRLENVHRFAVGTYVEADDPLNGLWRYQLYEDGSAKGDGKTKFPTRSGATDDPNVAPFVRRAAAEVECSPEHARMQTQLMRELRIEYPRAVVVREKDFVDVSVRTGDEIILFEIKSDVAPRSVIRQALGQILEYAYHPTRTHDLPVRLVIVGRREMNEVDSRYLGRLRRDFNLPLEYRCVALR